MTYAQGLSDDFILPILHNDIKPVAVLLALRSSQQCLLLLGLVLLLVAQKLLIVV